jgi:hypothetical protein
MSLHFKYYLITNNIDIDIWFNWRMLEIYRGQLAEMEGVRTLAKDSCDS